MRIEILIFAVTAFLIANIYTEGKYMKMLQSGKKYYQMAGIAFGALMLYVLIKRNPMRANDIMSTTNDYIKYLPIDKGTTNMISPILDFTSRHNFANNQYASIDGQGYEQGYDQDQGYNYPIIAMPNGSNSPMQNVANQRLATSGKKATKRSVSETKKKFVASRQHWRCGKCQTELTAWFEVDHVKRLEYGGSNHIDNLVALCRDCHGEKTTMENL
jgi:5-methylcytosine-specific restriction endonuclease McrA